VAFAGRPAARLGSVAYESTRMASVICKNLMKSLFEMGSVGIRERQLNDTGPAPVFDPGLTRSDIIRHIPPLFAEFVEGFVMHAYRTHTCGVLRKDAVGSRVRLSGWVNRRRDHGGLLFIDLRDHYGITQCVVEPDAKAFAEADK